MKSVDVANYILSLENSDESDITPMKLQKLLYFAHGFHLAIFGTPLIDDEFEAQQFGPVSKPVLAAFKGYGAKVIDSKGSDLSNLDKRSKALVSDVFKVFNQYSASKLSSMTHTQGPWKEKGYFETISDQELIEFFITQKDSFAEMVEDLEDEEFFANYDNEKLKNFVSFDSI